MGFPRRLGDLHRQRGAAGRARRRAAPAVRGQGRRGARARAAPPGRRRDLRAARAPARRRVADRAAAPVAPGAPAALPARPCGARCAGARSASPARRRPPSRRPCATAGRRCPGPRKIYVKELLQADRARRPAAERARTSGICTPTSRTAPPPSPGTPRSIAGLPFSFTGHARDIYAEELNPHGWLRRKLLAAEFVVTCTEANRRHLLAIAPEASVHLVYHGLNADFARLVEADADERGAQRHAARARRRPPGGQEGVRRAGRRVRRAAPPRGRRSRR